MPKREASATGTLTAREAQQKVAGLITETDESRQAESPAPEEAASPAAPSETPPALTPPAPAANEPPTDETSETPTYEVSVDGETLQVDLEELRAGYSKHEDYKRKTMALAEERKSFEAESQAVQAERAHYAEGLRNITEALESLQGEPDWASLRQQLEPAEFLQQKADWEVSKAQTEKLKAERQKVAEQQQAEEAKKLQVYIRAEQDKLKVVLPDWADPEKAKTEAAKLRAHAKSYGFSDQEISQVTDHRTILLLRDALKYKELQREPNASAKAKTPAIRTARPGAAPPPPPANSQKEKLIERASQTGRMRDAVKVVEALLE